MPATSVKKTRKVIAKTVKVNRKPRKPTGKIITLSQYGTDLQRRLDIHNYEFYMFIEDIKKGINSILPYIDQSVTFTKNQYQRFVK
jgi:hypothetical protein|tara:strand:- start:232 stop:489 length:258 start_codon:yes stop_codon:yes gene_type:complete